MNPTVLVAEDDPVQRLLLRRALEPLGVEVRLARHGREALDLALEARLLLLQPLLRDNSRLLG